MGEIAIAITALIVPVAIGATLGRLRAFRDPDAAIDTMNRIALHVAFPPLVIASLCDPDTSIARSPAFLAAVPLSLAVALAITRIAARDERAGTIALVISFGNTAYLGLPFVAAVLGREVLAIAAVAVAIHVALAMTVGPTLLVRWGGTGAASGSVRALARQPLLWSPAIGLALRPLPAPWIDALRGVLEPLGALAAPLSMILLGLYLWVHRAKLRVDRDVAVHVAARLVLAPAITVALVAIARRMRAIDLEEARVLVVLSAMPAAITTFAIALEQRIGADRIAATIVVSTVASAITLPVAVAIASAL